MGERFYHGEMQRDSRDYRGWLVGSFVVEGLRRIGEVEVKYWEFERGLTGHPRKISSIVEFTALLDGIVRGEIDDEEILIRGGEYVIIPPNVPNNMTIEALESSRGLTVKAPSDPLAKRIVEPTSFETRLIEEMA
jgi:quercetin dioxygenase-like cupin family protein